MKYLNDNARQEFQTIYNIDQFLGFDKFRDHRSLIDSKSRFDLILFDTLGQTQNLINMASLLKYSFPQSEVNIYCLESEVHATPEINKKILENLQTKKINVFFDAEVMIDEETENICIWEKTGDNNEPKIQEIEFLFYSSFRKWPSYLTKSGIFRSDFDQNNLTHNTHSSIFLAGNLRQPQSSLFEKYRQAKTIISNVERKVPTPAT